MDPLKIKELRMRIRRGDTIPIDELHAALEEIRADRIALVGGKPPKKKATPEDKAAAKATKANELLAQLFGAGEGT